MVTRSLASRNGIESEGDSGRESTRTQDLVLALPLFALAALVRAIPWQYVLSPQGVIFRDGDGYAHMWRIWNAASKSIPLSARDPFANFPHGGEIVWPPAFDWILATAVRWLGVDQAAAELLCAWVPVVLGAAAVAIAALIASYVFSRTAGWLTGVLLAWLPGSFLYTQLGYLDHHAAMTLIGTLMLGGAMYIVSRDGAASRLWPVLAGVLCAFALLIWVGVLLHIAVLQIAMLVWALGAASRESADARTRRLAVAHAVIALAILPFSLRDWEIFGDFSPLVLTRFQPTWYGSGAICLASATLLWRIPLLGDSRVRRLASAAALGIIGICIAFVLVPELAGILDQSAGWFTGDVEFLARITELQPLFARSEHGFWWQPSIYLSPLFFVFPVALIAVGWRSLPPERALLLFWTAAFLALTLSQLRFVNTFSVAYSIVLGGAISLFLDWIGQLRANPRVRCIVRSCVGMLLVAMVAIPAWTYYAPRIRNAGRAIANPMRETRFVVARFLAKSRPPTLDENGEPTAGLMGIWDTGHEYRYYSGWAVHQDGFGPYVSPENIRLANRYYSASDEDTAIEILEKLGSRYVIADIQGAGQPPYSIRSITSRLVQLRGSGGELSLKASKRNLWIPALTRHRLVFGAPNDRGGVWLYEIVPGAVVVGSAEPGSLVSIDLQLETRSGTPSTWKNRGRVDETGTFRLRVPYASVDGPESDYAPIGRYRLRTSRGVTEFDVSEASIQDGATIMAPAFE